MTGNGRGPVTVVDFHLRALPVLTRLRLVFGGVVRLVVRRHKDDEFRVLAVTIHRNGMDVRSNR